MNKFLTVAEQNANTMLGVVHDLNREIKKAGVTLAHPQQLEYTLALESAIPQGFASVAGDIISTHKQLVKTLKDVFGAHKMDVALESDNGGVVAKDTPRWKQPITEAQWQAGAIILGIAGNDNNLKAYFKAANASPALESAVPGAAVFDVNRTNPSFDYQVNAALESFDGRNLEAFVGLSSAYNVQAARQDQAGEALYPTVVFTPDQTGLEISVRRVMIHNEIRHGNTGKPTNFSRVNLIDAIRNHKILSNDTTIALPIFITGDAENNAKFTTDVASYEVDVQGVMKRTAPLKPGIEIDLLGLANLAQVQANGTTDQFDSLDLRLTLNAIYVKITNASTSDTSIIKMNTKNLIYTGFYRAFEGLENDVNLSFLNKTLPIAGNTKDVTNAVADALVYFTDPTRVNMVVQLGVQMNGRGNLEFGTVSATPSAVTVENVLNKMPDGSYSLVTDAAVIAAVKAELGVMTVVGYDLGAFRSNLNRRSLGIICTTVAQRERHIIPLGAPITCANPLTSTATSTDVAAPITATRIRNSNNAITKLFDYCDQLKSLRQAYDQRLPVPQIEGIGGNLVKAYVEHKTFDVFAHVNSIKSQDRAADVSSALINLIRDMSYRGYRDSNYQPALDSESNTVGETPQLIIVTDPVTMRHLIVSGDTRTASIGFDFQVIESQDLRMVGEIFFTFARKGQNSVDPLSFGFMAWVPELVTNLPINRNGGTTQEIQVQPRTLHVNTLPILMRITVENLEAAIRDRVALPFKTVP